MDREEKITQKVRETLTKWSISSRLEVYHITHGVHSIAMIVLRRSASGHSLTAVVKGFGSSPDWYVTCSGGSVNLETMALAGYTLADTQIEPGREWRTQLAEAGYRSQQII